MKTTAKVGQKGSNYFFYLPKLFADTLNLQKGDTVELRLEETTLTVKKYNEMTLESLLATVPEDYDPRKDDVWSVDDIQESLGW